MPSIGSIFVDFVARTAQFQTDVKSASSSLEKAGEMMNTSIGGVAVSGSQMANAMERAGLRVGGMLIGGRTLAYAFGREIRQVISDIDNIKGVNPGVVESINEMRGAFAESQNAIELAAASLISFVNDAMVSVGAFLARASMIGPKMRGMSQVPDGTDEGLRKLHEDMEKALKLTPQYQAQLATASDALVAAQQRLRDVGATQGQHIDRLIIDAEALRKEASHYPADDITNSIKKNIEATNDQATSARGMLSLTKENTAAWHAYGEAVRKVNNVHEGTTVRISRLKTEISDLKSQLNMGSVANISFGAAGLEKNTEKVKELTARTKELGIAMAKLKEPATIMRDSFVHGIQSMSQTMAEFIVTGQANFANFFKMLAEQIISTFIKLAFINPMLNSMFGATTGWSMLPAMFGFAEGGDPPVGVPSMVGENGPEMFVPKTAGTIVPNSSLSSVKGGSSSPAIHLYYNITSGVTFNDLRPILEAHGRKVQYEVSDAMRRGGSGARAFGK